MDKIKTFAEEAAGSPKAPLGLVWFILNIVWPGFGTFINAFTGHSAPHVPSIIAGLVMMFLCWLVVPWIWSIYHGFVMFTKQA